MRYFVLLVTLVVTATNQTFFSQIESGKVGKDAKKVDKVKDKKQSSPKDSLTKDLPESSLFFATSVGQSFRILKENVGIYGEALGERSNETPVYGFQFQAGLRSQLDNNWFAVFGLGVNQNGEQYSYVASDSSYAYTTRYRHVTMPIGIQFNAGNQVRFVGTLGLQPQLFVSYQQSITSKDQTGEETKTKVKQLSTLNQFAISSFAQAGLEWRLSSQTSIYLTPELRYQLTNTFSKQAPYKHNAFVFGLQAGVFIGL